MFCKSVVTKVNRGSCSGTSSVSSNDGGEGTPSWTPGLCISVNGVLCTNYLSFWTRKLGPEPEKTLETGEDGEGLYRLDILLK